MWILVHHLRNPIIYLNDLAITFCSGYSLLRRFELGGGGLQENMIISGFADILSPLAAPDTPSHETVAILHSPYIRLSRTFHAALLISVHFGRSVLHPANLALQMGGQ